MCEDAAAAGAGAGPDRDDAIADADAEASPCDSSADTAAERAGASDTGGPCAAATKPMLPKLACRVMTYEWQSKHVSF
jgi:hypothetical protein